MVNIENTGNFKIIFNIAGIVVQYPLSASNRRFLEQTLFYSLFAGVKGRVML